MGKSPLNMPFDKGDVLHVTSAANAEVVRIAPDGSIYWRGKLVEGDEDFRKAMLDMAEHIKIAAHAPWPFVI